MNNPEIVNPPHPALNRYGQSIETVPEGDALRGQTLAINGNPAISENPDRYKQHGFYFNADNCIACHACESACSEKNDLPAHLVFRSVGYVEGGAWPDYHRLNLSMACNHCDDPVCLKGCPTGAYTKFAEYGAVLQDPDICFGCGYCTWVCPYNAPQLDPIKGQVEKCNMCVDRLEQGLKPACAAACLAGALDFGVIETTPANRTQLLTQIPGFPDPAITHPNIRFQQTKSLPRELTRPDSMPLRYVRDDAGVFQPQTRAATTERSWNLRKLRSREDPLVVFTLATQTAVGAFAVLFLGPRLGLEVLAPASYPLTQAFLLAALVGLMVAGLVLSALHLGKPQRFYRGFNNLRYSPVSREAAAIVVFLGLLGGYALLTAFPPLFAWLPANVVAPARATCGWGALVTGSLAIHLMVLAYRIPARPFWNHWQTWTAFFGSTFALGVALVGAVYGAVLVYQGEALAPLWRALAWPLIAGIVLEGVGLVAHARDLARRGGEGAASHHEQRTAFGKTYLARNVALAVAGAMASGLALAGVEGWTGLIGWGLIAATVAATAFVGRALFYVLVIPTTMPGAFFWRNRGFQEHARATGLADMPQVGVVPDAH